MTESPDRGKPSTTRGRQPPGQNSGGEDERQRRAARLAEALRANLRRRKAAGRPEGAEETDPPATEAGPAPA